ncbi:MAG: DUF418 domain-containing protein [Micromonosporaceae bacterium]|nr:DUF418 domain-containing protein [Micromonosporaceae bacterium]
MTRWVAPYGRLGWVRIAGIDIARGLALLGMFVAHAAPPIGGGGIAATLIEVPDERSRLLFAVTAGLGLGLLTGGIRPPGPADRDARQVLRRQIAIRAVCLLVLGIALQATGVLVYVILDEYGIAFLLMLPIVYASARWLLAAGVALLVLAPGAMAALATVLGRPTTPLDEWFVTGAYPVLTWVAVIMIGVGVVRLDLARRAVVATAGGLGLVAMVAGLGLSIALGGDGIAAEPRAGEVPLTIAAVGTSAFTVGNVGFDIALTMLCVALTSTVAGLSRRTARRVAAVLSPVGAAGAMPLSVYTVHLLVLLAVTHQTPGGYPTDDGWPVVIGLAIGALTVPWLWRRYFGRGPLEYLIGRLSGRVPRAGRDGGRRNGGRRAGGQRNGGRRGPDQGAVTGNPPPTTTVAPG